MNTSMLVMAIAGALLLTVVLAFFTSTMLQRTFLRRLTQRLNPGNIQSEIVNFSSLESLPEPVRRYFHFALTDGQAVIKQVQFHQQGKLKADIQSPDWMPFTAHHIACMSPAGFVWVADIAATSWLRINVIDSFLNGTGLSRASLFRAFPMATDTNLRPLNEAALQRYLAEAAWYPTGLLPQCGVSWTAIDDHSALATLSVGGVTVSLTFHFGDRGELLKVFTPVRYRKTSNGYQPTPWEGHFSRYTLHNGMQIPLEGEVGWYDNDVLKRVWKGTLSELEFRF